MTEAPPARAPRLRGARAVFTGRLGGVSAGHFSSLNLAHHVGDDPGAVAQNRALVDQTMGAPAVYVDQVHGTTVHVLPATGEVPVVTADAAVTTRTDRALAIMVADCLPVLFSDDRAGVIGAAHAGRRGLLDGVLEATITAMVGLGARPDDLEIVIGPGICGRCYEVPAAMQEEAARLLPATATETRWGTPALDLRAGARQALERAGAAPGSIHDEDSCTREDEGLFSYRRQSVTGRFAGLIRRD